MKIEKKEENRITKLITQCYCPIEFGIEGRCSTGGCSLIIMAECWKETLTKYNIKFGSRSEFKHKFNEYSYNFEPINFMYEKELELICIDDDCCGDLISGNYYIAIGENTGRYILKDLEGEYVKCYFKTIELDALTDNDLYKLNSYIDTKIESMINEYIDLEKVTNYEEIPKILKKQGLELICLVQQARPKKRKFCVRKIETRDIINYFIINN